MTEYAFKKMKKLTDFEKISFAGIGEVSKSLEEPVHPFKKFYYVLMKLIKTLERVFFSPRWRRSY